MSLFEIFDDLPEPDLGTAYLMRVTKERVLTDGDIKIIAGLLSPPKRIYPCQRCSRNVSVIVTGNHDYPAKAICDGCNLTPPECSCERIPYERI